MVEDVINLIVGFAAIVGMGLGIYNLFKARDDDQVKLRVIPKAVMVGSLSQGGKEYMGRVTSEHRADFGELQDEIAIEVINLSKFPVVIHQVGFGKAEVGSNLVVANPIVSDGGAWPRRLESRESVEICARRKPLLDAVEVLHRDYAFAVTACNHTAVGTSPALKQLVT